MIGQLRGKLADKRPNQVLVEVGGVGYQVQIPLSTFAGLGALHGEVTLLIHTHLREDQIALYGFLTAREKQCFEMLISTSGVGPSLALKILSGMSLDELVPAIRRGDVVRLKRIPGVGQKTAERIVVELRDKLAAVDVAETGKPPARSQVEADVASALVNLGYEARVVEKTIQQVRGNGDFGFDSLLRAVLQKLGGAAAVEKRAGAARGA
ncbi:MAG TPA: Holliday junction branch migration protein RuvA [Candidatus Acidoferrales bacterium]|nr:Holliday junction branch migration protein RuvA [Candidatus Acidoferrales bacterium]